ncbi:MAG: hypothetical protein AMXMBFR84_23870 [Candidatus Hydrogenedentota bacterium]
MSRTCDMCASDGEGDRWVTITIHGEEQVERTMNYCPTCAGKYLNAMDMMGMTLDVVKSVQTNCAA